MRKVFIATPCYGDVVYSGYMLSMLRLSSIHNTLFQIYTLGNESLITRARNVCVSQFLQSDYQYLFFIDADIEFSELNIQRILDYDQDVVCGCYARKGLFLENLRGLDLTNMTLEEIQSKVLSFNYNISHINTMNNGFMQVDQAATGFMCIRRNVLEQMMEKYPEQKYIEGDIPYLYTFFDCVVNESKKYLSEDFAFCEKWRAIGGKIWMDTTQPLTHCGTFKFTGNLKNNLESIKQPETNNITFNTKYGLITLNKYDKFFVDVFNQGKYWDEDTLCVLRDNYIRPGNFLEIGGHVGTSTLFYSKCLVENYKIYTFEPQKKMYELLLHNISQNHIQNKVVASNQALFCFKGYIQMHCTPLDGPNAYNKPCVLETENQNINYGGLCVGKDGENINCTTMDSLNIDNVSFIHCDAQGAEPFIFACGRQFIAKNRPVILYENMDLYGTYLYDNIKNSYPQYEQESKFQLKTFCVEELNYFCIDNFLNSGYDSLLIPFIPLNTFEQKIYSQNGEDGITIKLIELVYKNSSEEKYFVEFCVQDGTECNSRILIKNFNWNGLQMDGSYENALIKKEFVTNENILEIFNKYNVPHKINILSIDIDYNNFYILNTILKNYQCDITICEYNASHLPNEDKIVLYDSSAKCDGSNYFGASLLSLTKLANKFNYSLVYCDNNGVNCFFVSNHII